LLSGVLQNSFKILVRTNNCNSKKNIWFGL
jgi:hypothetical protein